VGKYCRGEILAGVQPVTHCCGGRSAAKNCGMSHNGPLDSPRRPDRESLCYIRFSSTFSSAHNVSTVVSYAMSRYLSGRAV
jgi:hypothetical protein